MKINSNLQLLTYDDLSNPDNADAFFSLLHRNPAFLPEKYDNREPVKKPFGGNSSAQFRKDWDFTVLMERKKPPLHISCNLTARKPRLYADCNFRFAYGNYSAEDTWNLMLDLTRTFSSDYGQFHPLPAVEQERNWPPRTVTGGLIRGQDVYSVYVTAHSFTETLPDLFLWNFFGPAMIERYGIDISKLPSEVESGTLDSGGVYIKLVDDPAFIEKDHAEFCRIRLAAKEALGLDRFASKE